ncbi:MAG: phosphorylase, partial [Sphingomonadaceae bacterium]
MILAACGLLREARIVTRAGLVAVPGGGDSARLEAALEVLARDARAIISIGICGALSPGLKVGDVVVGDSETDSMWRAALTAQFPHAHIGAVYAQDAMLATADDKASTHRKTGAIAVDMESHIAARVAARHGLPFAILRVVSDRADQTLPPAARVGMKPDGGIALGAVLASLAQNPAQLPALIKTGINADIAFRQLAHV